MIHNGSGSVEGSAGRYFGVLGQYGAVVVGTWWYLVSITWYCLVLVLVLGQYEALMPVCIEKV